MAAGVDLCGAAGNSPLRVGLRSEHLLTFSPAAFLKALVNVAVVLGIMALVWRYIVQLALLSRADLTDAVPLTSTSYIAIIGAFALDDHVSAVHWLGIVLIIGGVVMIARTRPLTTGSDPE